MDYWTKSYLKAVGIFVGPLAIGMLAGWLLVKYGM